MTTEEALKGEAAFFARRLQGLSKQDAYGLSREAVQARVFSYPPRLGRDYLCPRCWIKDGARSTLRSVPGTNEYDILKCNSNACAAEFIVPF